MLKVRSIIFPQDCFFQSEHYFPFKKTESVKLEESNAHNIATVADGYNQNSNADQRDSVHYPLKNVHSGFYLGRNYNTAAVFIQALIV